MFGIFKTYKDIKSGVKDPTGFGQGMLLDVFKAPLVLFTIIGSLIVLLFFILGFTNLLLSSLILFKVLFWFTLIPFIILEVVFWSIYRKIKKMVRAVRGRVDEEINTINVDVEKPKIMLK